MDTGQDSKAIAGGHVISGLCRFGRLPDSGGKGQKRPLGIERNLFRYGREWLDGLHDLVRYDYAGTGSAWKKGGTGKTGFMVCGFVGVAGVLPGQGCGVYLFPAAFIVGAAGHARQEQNVKGEEI